jgi:hypothetical protein
MSCEYGDAATSFKMPMWPTDADACWRYQSIVNRLAMAWPDENSTA